MTAVAPAPPAAVVRQLVLPGQAAAPEGPVDVAGMYVVHWAFRRDLDLFRTVATTTPARDRARWRRLARRFALFSTVLHKHHSGEDAGLWPLLRDRGADVAVLDALEAEHAGIDPLLAACATDLAALADGTGDEATRRSFATHAAGLRDALSAHLGHEERDGMSLVQQHLTPADWDRLDREVFAPEYEARDVLPVLGWIMAGLPPEGSARIPAPAPLVALGRVLGRRVQRADARHLLSGLGAQDRVLVQVSRVLAAVHTRVVRSTGGRRGNRWMGGDVLLLTHRGRTSGRLHTTPLLHKRDGADLVVAASNGGIDREPQWWLNLQADPRAEVEVGGRRFAVVAREADDADRDRLWELLKTGYAGYDDYQARVRRRIAVVRLTPVG